MSLLARLPCKVQFWTEGFRKKPWTGQPLLFMIQTLALWLKWNGLLGGTSIYWNLIWFNWSEWILVNHAVVSKMARFHQHKYISTYPKVASSSMSRLVAHYQIFRRLMKWKFDVYVLWPLTKKFQNWIVDRSTARDFTVLKVLNTCDVSTTLSGEAVHDLKVVMNF